MAKNINEKHEKILVWARLSDFTGRDLVNVGNRIIRKERIAQRAEEIREEVSAFEWRRRDRGWLVTINYTPGSGRKQPHHWIYVEPAGKTTGYSDGFQMYDCYLLDNENMAVSHHRYTCYRTRWQESEYPSRIYPDGDKRFYDVLRNCWNFRGWKKYKKRRKVLNDAAATS